MYVCVPFNLQLIYVHTHTHTHTCTRITAYIILYIDILETVYDFNKTSVVIVSPRPSTTIDGKAILLISVSVCVLGMSYN